MFRRYSVDEIYKDLVRHSVYDEKYNWKQRFRITTPDIRNKGGSLDFCEYLVERLRLYEYEAHIVFTKKDYKFLHAAVVYKDAEEDKYYIADPITDVKKFTDMKEISQPENVKRDVEEYIKEFGEISLYNIYTEEGEKEYISNYTELEKGLEFVEEYDEFGFNKYKMHENGTIYDDEGFDYTGINRRGFNRQGVHCKTNTQYDERGLNKDGKFEYNDDGYNFLGFDRYYRHRNGTMYDNEGYDYGGYNRKGYNRQGIHRKTNTPYNPEGYKENGEYYYDDEGYDYRGYNEKGYDKKGYNKRGFKENRIHKNGTLYDDEGYDFEGYDFEGYDKQGIDTEGYNKQGYNEYGVNRKGINAKTGERDVRIILVEEFMNSNTSRQMFCKQKNIDLDNFNKILKEIFKIYPSIEIREEDIHEEAKKSSAIFLAKREKIFKQLINGEINFEEYCHNNRGVKFQDLLLEAQDKDKEKILYKIIGDGFASQKYDMMDYIRVFVKGKIDNGIYKKTMEEFIKFEKECLKHKDLLDIYKKLKKEEKRLAIYKEPFFRDTCSKRIGHRNTETGEFDFIEITDEHIEYAKQHLFNIGKYVCRSNMEDVFRQFARGELSFEDIKTEEINNTDLQQLNLEQVKLEKEAESIKEIEALIDEKNNNGLNKNGG